jgi:hypothetical protein
MEGEGGKNASRWHIFLLLFPKVQHFAIKVHHRLLIYHCSAKKQLLIVSTLLFVELESKSC